ncbi:LacI family DNA-binding transcriptional regulator [Synoicihabitans lomoniglobus]|uniref:LacI family DNA-binding transcriptional regulator n=1 Tax=Synoicihabitans lomoniglobus TaxID=2909285 RepID=A0AAE9ZVR0_9BACT|nr:LacI family transcriptional regulator [Opitutaceae bacterium LMO-M01]WED64044.1 LacI family DNA-binding transcriptional regulator [Opitutaceae bacterium LMO-M01]
MARCTLADIARRVGCSKYTVSLALKDNPQISLETRERVQAAAADMGYEPNAVLSQLMAQLRASRTTRFQAKLALINANRDPHALQSHPTIPTYVAGCEARAEKTGYAFDRFWMHDPELKPERLRRILHTRGIKGILLVGLMDSNRLPPEYTSLWETFPTVVTGVRTRDPDLSFCCVDHHHLALQAIERAIELGYRRPGLVLDDVIDRLVERRFSAGFQTGQRELPRTRRLPIFDLPGSAAEAPAGFETWLDQHRPDVVFTLYNRVVRWIKATGRRIPEDIGVIQLEWRATSAELAGMNQHNFAVGEAAVDMLVTQIHNNETGVNEFPRATLIGATWTDGTSAPELKSSTARAAGAGAK